MALSKRRYIIDSDHSEGSVDTFRSASLKYWTKSEGLISIDYANPKNAWDTNAGVYFNITCSSQETNSETKFYSFTENITIQANTTYFDSADASISWSDYVSSIVDTSTTYYDHTSEAPMPFGLKEIENYSNISSPMVADVETNYNFYVDPYEKQTRVGTVPEQVLPNLYAFMFEQEAENLDSDKTEFARLNTLQNTIPDVFKDMLNRKGEKIGERDEGQYHGVEI